MAGLHAKEAECAWAESERSSFTSGHKQVLVNVRYGRLLQRADFSPVRAGRRVDRATDGAKPWSHTPTGAWPQQKAGRQVARKQRADGRDSST